MRESEGRFRQLAEALPEIVYTIDAEGRTDYLNPRWFEYTGQPPDTDPEDAVADIIHPADAERVTPVGELVELTIAPLQLGRPLGYALGEIGLGRLLAMRSSTCSILPTRASSP